MPSLHKALVIGGVALVAFAIVAFIQRKVVAIPVAGQYLPR